MRGSWPLMNVHGVRQILTFNTGDFVRFEIEALHPSAVASVP
jgi:hypothetical protein